MQPKTSIATDNSATVVVIERKGSGQSWQQRREQETNHRPEGAYIKPENDDDPEPEKKPESALANNAVHLKT